MACFFSRAVSAQVVGDAGQSCERTARQRDVTAGDVWLPGVDTDDGGAVALANALAQEIAAVVDAQVTGKSKGGQNG